MLRWQGFVKGIKYLSTELRISTYIYNYIPFLEYVSLKVQLVILNLDTVIPHLLKAPFRY